MSDVSLARMSLRLNAGFSLLSGLGLLAAGGVAAQMLFAVPADWQPVVMRVLGAGLLIFALDLLFLAANPLMSRREVLMVSAMDLGWVLGSVVLLAAAGSLFSDLGTGVIAVVALAVAGFAIGQTVGAGRLEAPVPEVSVREEGDRLLARVSRYVNAPRDVVWEVMNDHPGYADVADNIAKVEVVDGAGMGMVRRCSDPKGNSWAETCDLYDEGRAYGFRIHTEAADYPYPMSDLSGRWRVAQQGAGSEFAIEIVAKPKGSWLMRKMFVLAAKRQFSVVLVKLADAWADRMEREVRAG